MVGVLMVRKVAEIRREKDEKKLVGEWKKKSFSTDTRASSMTIHLSRALSSNTTNQSFFQ